MASRRGLVTQAFRANQATMYRFWFLPFLITVCSVLLCFLYFGIFAYIYFPVMGSIYSNFPSMAQWELNDYIIEGALSVGTYGGIPISLLAVGWDYLKNSRSDHTGHQTAQRLLPNMGWFILYAFMWLAANILVLAVLRPFAPLMTTGMLYWLEEIVAGAHMIVGAVGILAFVLVIFYSINTSDTLAPHTLRDKLRRVRHLETG